HRLGALALTLVLLLLAWQLHRAGLSRLAGLLLLALGVQISLGISNVVFHLPLLLAVAHNAGGALLLLTLVLVNYRLRASSVGAGHARETGAAEYRGHGLDAPAAATALSHEEFRKVG
ncbi:MAG: COX15/CtaA family protein, partial [Pseudomonas sp.]|uniref:COX15/CtaA family protein n=1 Tax=Pseudomonas sp. TaxID=306 RepID=UPI003BB55DDE